MRKRGQTQQFNWLFVLIAGAILLAFFVGFAFKYRDLQIKRENAEIGRGIDNIINGLKVTEQYDSMQFSLPFELSFGCEYFIVNDDYRQELNDKVVFSYDILSREILGWTQEFKVPFRVDNLFYLVDLNDRYYLVGGGDEVLRKLPGPLKDSFKQVNQVRDEEGTFIFFVLPSNVNKLKEKGKVIYVDELNKRIVFYNDNKEITYLGEDALLFAAIFSKDYNVYECGFNKLVEKTSTLVKIYIEKANQLNNARCSYGDVIIELRKLDAAVRRRDHQQLNLAIYDLEQKNYDLSNRDCEVVF